MTLLFLKRLNDTFEENAEKLIKDGKSEKEAYHNKIKGSKTFGQFGQTQRRNQEHLFLTVLVFFGLQSLPNQPF